jgi:DinB superfamily
MPFKTAPATLREHLLYLLSGGGAHTNFDTAITGIPIAFRGKRPKGASHSPWEIIEHMRIAQWDILEFSRDARHVSPAWPEGCWPKNPVPPRASDWQKSIKAFRRDLKAMQRLVANPRSRLFARIAHGDGQTLLREALLIADHNAYHLGELIVVRRLLGAWK